MSKKKVKFIPGVSIGILVLCAAPLGVLAMSELPKEIEVAIDSEKSTIKTSADTVKELLSELEHDYISTDKLNYELSDEIVKGMEIELNSQKKVKLSVNGEKMESTTNSNTVSDVLNELDIELGEKDIVIPTVESKLEKKETVTVIQYREEQYEKTSKIPYETKESFSFEIPYGETKISQKGSDGVLEKKYKKEFRNEVVISDEKISENVVKQPTERKVIVGTKETVKESVDYESKEVKNSSMFKGETKVVQSGEKGVKTFIYKNTGKKRELVSSEVTKEPESKIVEIGTKSKPAPEPKVEPQQASKSSAQYSLSEFKFNGVINSGGKKWTYYSQAVLPGNGLNIPGRHVNSGGYVADGAGYIVIAANRSIPKGTIVNTPFGYKGKVYDMCAACSSNWYDVYTK